MRSHTAVLLALFLAGSVHAADEPLVRAIELPKQADRLRRAGVPADQVGDAVRATRAKGLSASEATEVLEEGADASEDQGPMDNFGEFVNDKLDEGLRGRDLARAIHEEHARRGKGGGPKEGKGPPADDADKAKGKGPPADKGKGGKGKGKGGH